MGNQREQALLDAARIVLRKKPISQVTIEELAVAAGIARSGFYFYFESKHALLAALADRVIGESGQKTAEWLTLDGLNREALRRGLARGLGRLHLEGHWLSEVFIAPDPGPEIRRLHSRLVKNGCSALAARIGRDADAGLTVEGPTELIARMVFHLNLFTMADAVANPAVTPDDVLLDTLTDATLRLLYGATPG